MTDEKQANHGTYIFQALMAADSFQISGSPLLAGWYDHNADGHSKEGLDPGMPEEMALHASWESEGLIYEEILTVGDLFSAQVDGNGVIQIPRADGNLEIYAFKHVPALRPMAAAQDASFDAVKAAVLGLHKACEVATASGAFDAMAGDTPPKVINDFCDAVDEAMIAHGLKDVDEENDGGQAPVPRG